MPRLTKEEYKFLTLCNRELSCLRTIIGICPKCHNGLIMEGYVCNNCGFDPKNN